MSDPVYKTDPVLLAQGLVFVGWRLTRSGILKKSNMKQSYEQMDLKRQKLRAELLLDIDNELSFIRNSIMNPDQQLSLNDLIRLYGRLKVLQRQKSYLWPEHLQTVQNRTVLTLAQRL